MWRAKWVISSATVIPMKTIIREAISAQQRLHMTCVEARYLASWVEVHVLHSLALKDIYFCPLRLKACFIRQAEVRVKPNCSSIATQSRETLYMTQIRLSSQARPCSHVTVPQKLSLKKIVTMLIIIKKILPTWIRIKIKAGKVWRIEKTFHSWWSMQLRSRIPCSSARCLSSPIASIHKARQSQASVAAIWMTTRLVTQMPCQRAALRKWHKRMPKRISC